MAVRPSPPAIVPALAPFRSEVEWRARRTGRWSRFARTVGALVSLLTTVGGMWWAATLPTPIPAPPRPGVLRVDSDPRGAEVVVDGIAHGMTPAAVWLRSGQHVVSVRYAGQVQEIRVAMTDGAELGQFVTWVPSPSEQPPGGVASAPAMPVTVARPSIGWVRVVAKEPLEVYDGLRRLGTSNDRRMALPPGDHELDLVAEPLGFRQRRTVRIVPGQEVVLAVPLPHVSLSINARPWADVWIDGVAVGQTPLGNVSQQIGVHLVEFRHPDFATRRMTFVVSLRAPARLAVDLTREAVAAVEGATAGDQSPDTSRR